MNDTITLPRYVVEQALEAWEQARGALAYVAVGNAPSNPNLSRSTCSQAVWVLDNAEPALRAALEQTDMGNPVSVPQGWKLVPSKLTDSQRQAAQDAWSNACNAEMYWDRIYAAMLDATPQPPVGEQPETVPASAYDRLQSLCDNQAARIIELEQPQVEQEPVAYEYVEHRPYGAPGEIKRGTILLEHYRNADGTIAGDWEWLIEQFKNAKTTISMRPLYTHPQLPRQPLTDQQIHDCFQQRHRDKATERRMIARAIERAHGIGGEA